MESIKSKIILTQKFNREKKLVKNLVKTLLYLIILTRL